MWYLREGRCPMLRKLFKRYYFSRDWRFTSIFQWYYLNYTFITENQFQKLKININENDRWRKLKKRIKRGKIINFWNYENELRGGKWKDRYEFNFYIEQICLLKASNYQGRIKSSWYDDW